MELKNKIIEVATSLFRRMGVKAVTMDDIAREAGVSKKTIYQEFEDKSTLVYEAFSAFLEREECVLNKIFEQEDDVIQHFVQVSQFMKEQYSGMNPLILNEIRRYYPKSWKRFEEFKLGKALNTMVDLLKRGKEAGYFRKEIDVEILAMLRLEQIAFDFRSLPSAADFSMVDLQLQIFDHFIHGILTQKGREAYLSKLINS
ncbi:MAG TPA: TetR/AcrR family transcriptional regulator [Cyclobacteriaceae bacterium]|nr:TetR/AcrR family transcriptional regulator [Cyclobacteriaceae bacterium]